MKIAVFPPNRPDYGWFWRLRTLSADIMPALAELRGEPAELVVASPIDDVSAFATGLDRAGAAAVKLRPSHAGPGAAGLGLEFHRL